MPADARLDELLGAGAGVFCASMDLLPDPVGVWWAVRDVRGGVVDFETGYSNPAMLALFGATVESSLGRRLVEESPAYRNEAAFRAVGSATSISSDCRAALLARARLLVDGILEYSRSGAAAQVGDVDMAIVVADVLSSLSASAGATGATFEVGELPTVRGNAPQLGRVMQNLVANSLKYRSDEPPHVTIAAERRDRFWVFTVEDNGAGIPPELGDDAFALFKRTGAHDDASCGIGLAVCRRIVETHGGAIVAEPARIRGTAMRFSLPD